MSSPFSPESLEQFLAATQPKRELVIPSPEKRVEVAKMVNSSRLLKAIRQLVEFQCEGLSLYRPASPVACAFHESRAKYRVADGSNRSGKTTAGSAESSRAFTGTDPFDKYQRENGMALMVALDTDHLATLYRRIFRPGPFKIIQDEQTRMWRAVRADPNNPSRLDPYDDSYREKWRDAPPLVPQRMVAKEAWEDKGRDVPKLITLTNGWKILWRSADGKAVAGEHWNLVQYDEENSNPAHFHETIRGLTRIHEPIQHEPRFIWSATSEVANQELSRLRKRAAEGDSEVGRFVFLGDDNPYVSPEARAQFFKSIPKHLRATKYYGIPAMCRSALYPMWDPQGVHGCDEIEIPKHWSRWLFVDPGRTSGTILAAVDPDERNVWIYGGFALDNASARQWAAEVQKAQDGVRFEGAVMDSQCGKQNRAGLDGRTIAEQYAVALRELDVTFGSIGPMSGFYEGLADMEARSEALRNWMELRPTGPFFGEPVLKKVRGVLPELDDQIADSIPDPKNPKKRLKDPKVPCDLVEALEYGAAFRPFYREPVVIATQTESPAMAAWRHKQAKKRRSMVSRELG